MSSPKLLAALLLLPALALAQSSSTITGRVIDQSQAPVPNAKVVALAVETGVAYPTKTNGDGYYNLPSLPPVLFTVTAEFAGFKVAESAQFKLNTTDTARIDLTLLPADSRQTIEVSASAGVIETQSSMTGGTVSQREIDLLPLEDRNSLALALTLPGVAGDVGSDEGGIYQTTPSAGANLVIGGGRTSSSAFMADGASATSVTLGRQTVTFSSDTIQEFKVITSTFSAQYGVTGGGIVSTISKSGTNDLHGSAFWYTRNPALAARQFNSPLPPPFRRNEFGFTLGGPVWIPKVYNGRQKTFFFYSMEPKRWVNATVQYVRVPTDAERQGDFRNMWVAPGQTNPLLYQQMNCSDANCGQFAPLNRANGTTVYPLFSANDPDPTKAGHVIPKQFLDPLVQKLLLGVPAPNMPYDAVGNNYVGARGVTGRDNRWNLKVDHNISDRNRLTVRFTDIPNFSDRYLLSKGDFALQSYPSDDSHTTQGYLSDTHTFSSRIVNEFRVNATHSNYSSVAPGDLGTVNYTQQFGLPNVTGWGYPRFSLSGTQYLAPSLGMGNSQLLGNYIENSYQFSDDVTLTYGRHTVTTGVDIRRMQSNVMAGTLGDACCGNYSYTTGLTASGNSNIPTGAGGLAFGSFLLGVPNSAALAGLVLPYYYRWNTAAAYVQDDFKLKSNLTLNIGLRWQYNSPRAEKYDRQAGVDFTNPVPLKDASGRTTSYTLNYVYSGFSGSHYLEPTHKANFEPRFGFAWTPNYAWNSRKAMVIRGGYGISHAPQTGRGRDPLPNFGSGSGGNWNYVQWTGTGAQPTTQSKNPQYLIGVGRNAPVVNAPAIVLQIPTDGTLCAGCTPVDPRVPSGTLIAFEPHNQVPYIQTWNLTTQYALTSRYVLTLNYLGQRGVHLFSPVYNVNSPNLQAYQGLLDSGVDPTQSIPDPFGRVNSSGNVINVTRQDLLRPFPTLGDVQVAGVTSSNSIYQAGVVEMERRFSGFYGFRFNYTWSKSIDNASNGQTDSGNWTNGRFQDALNIRGNRSVSFYDSRHRLNITGTLNVPIGKGQRFNFGKLGNAVLGGWSMSGVAAYYSGIPFAPYLGDNNGIPGGSTRPQVIRPDMLVGVPIVNPLWNKSVANTVPYVNPAAFSRPTFGREGNASRTLDYFRNPWTQSVNMSFFREIHPFENRKRYLQLRGELFNVFNHTYFQLNGNSSPQLFTGSLPLTYSGLSLAGPIPYLPGKAGTYPVGSREASLANAYNSNFGMFLAANNAAGRIVQLALKLYW